MGAARTRRRIKERDGESFQSTQAPGAHIHLQNPVGLKNQYPQWIHANACQWETLASDSFRHHDPVAFAEFLAAAPDIPIEKRLTAAIAAMSKAGSNLHVAIQDSAKGQHLVLCGAGPSANQHAAEWCPQADQIWGCNSALTWLHDNGYKPTHGFTVDQTPEMLNEWRSTPDVEYLLASTVHPHLSELLHARKRQIRYFHNYVGIEHRPVEMDGEIIPYEAWLYQILYPSTLQCGSGLNSVNRALDLAIFMGFARITILGADCALRVDAPAPKPEEGIEAHNRWLRESVVMHADGGHALTSGATAITLTGVIDGREWLTKPDMIISAVHLEKARQAHNRRTPGRVVLIGDTLPNALKDKPDDYLSRLPALIDGDGKPSALVAEMAF